MFLTEDFGHFFHNRKNNKISRKLFFGVISISLKKQKF